MFDLYHPWNVISITYIGYLGLLWVNKNNTLADPGGAAIVPPPKSGQA